MEPVLVVHSATLVKFAFVTSSSISVSRLQMVSPSLQTFGHVLDILLGAAFLYGGQGHLFNNEVDNVLPNIYRSFRWLRLSYRNVSRMLPWRCTQADVLSVAQLQLAFGVLDVAAGLMIPKAGLQLRGYCLGLVLAATGFYSQLVNGGSARGTGIFTGLIALGFILHQ